MLSFYDGHGLWKQFAKELSAVLINELNQLADFPIKFSSVHSLEAIHRSLGIMKSRNSSVTLTIEHCVILCLSFCNSNRKT